MQNITKKETWTKEERSERIWTCRRKSSKEVETRSSFASPGSVNSRCKSTLRATDIICQSICTDWFFYCLQPSKRPPRPDTLRNANSHRSNTFSTWLKFFEWENHYPDALSVPAERLDWFLFPAYTFRPFLRFLLTFRDSYNLLSPSVCIIE